MKPMVKKFLLLSLMTFCLGQFTNTLAAGNPFKAGPDGLRFKELSAGQGEVADIGDVATIHFSGWVSDEGVRGREVFNSRKQGQPVAFVIGTAGVMDGWNKGVIGMQVGGKRLLLVPPAMAWGAREIEGVVAENTAMMFRIELIGLDSSQVQSN